ncbi:MAG: hypothetical protein M3O70_24750, partial [Actinomycetota bacterium]|nr:hypothetical protein [Actinomycetota bacterium]
MSTGTWMAGSGTAKPWLNDVALCPLFAELSAAETDIILDRSHVQMFPSGATLLAQGNVANSLM